MDQSPEIHVSESELDQVIAEMLKKSFNLVQPPNTIWQHIRHLLESFIEDRQADECQLQ